MEGLFGVRNMEVFGGYRKYDMSALNAIIKHLISPFSASMLHVPLYEYTK